MMNTPYVPPGLPAIIALSRWAGDPGRDLAILAEGNTSIKEADRLLVKASGAFLADATEASFVEVRRDFLESFIDSGEATDDDVASALREAMTWGGHHPSVETLLHVVCQRYPTVQAVLHTHPTPVNALLCSTAAESLTGSYFPDQIVSLGAQPLLLPYVDPGLTLARHAQDAIRQHVARHGEPPKVVYLRNHGMFALGSSVTEAQQITSMAAKTARILLAAGAVGAAVPLSAGDVKRIHTRPDELRRRAALRRSR